MMRTRSARLFDYLLPILAALITAAALVLDENCRQITDMAGQSRCMKKLPLKVESGRRLLAIDCSSSVTERLPVRGPRPHCTIGNLAGARKKVA